MNKVELLSPAGDENAFKASILAGCDAIYFGLENFNARQRAENLKTENISKLIKIAKSKNVKCYLTVNILIYDEEIISLLELITNAVNSGIDAVIVQDFGIVYLIQKLFPQLEIHASTQMTTHNLLQCQLLSKENIKQVNLSRELSLEQLRPLVEFLNKNNIVAEIFVHGAYCISFSGQCYFSNYLYSEAGNRGNCVQPCRREFSLIENNSMIDNNYGKQKFEIKNNTKNRITPFNLKDNSAYSLAKDIINLGNVSLKIEGRIKNSDYVWATTKAWREQINQCLRNELPNKNSELLSSTMNRSFSSDYLQNIVSTKMFTYGSKDHSYKENGEVISYTAKNGELCISEECNTGDKVNILDDKNNFVCSGEIGQKINTGYKLNVTSKDFNKIYPKQKVFLQKDVVNKKQLEKQINELTENKKDLSIYVEGKENQKLQIIFDNYKDKITIESKSLLVNANNKSLTTEVLSEKLGKLGDTEYRLIKLDDSKLDKNLFLSLSELNELKRNGIEELSKNNSVKIINIENINNEFNKIQDDLQLCNCKVKEVQSDTKIVILLSSIDDYYNIKENELIFQLQKFINKKIFFAIEIPELIKDENDEKFLQIIKILQKENNLIPYIGSIIFDEQFWILEKLKEVCLIKEFIWTENSGCAKYFSDNNVKVLGGSLLNITNKFSQVFYKKYLFGFVPSCELSLEQYEKIVSTSLLECFVPVCWNMLLMQSKQCLTNKLSNCNKVVYDDNCKYQCEKKLLAIGKNKEKILAVKRQGFYSALFAENIIWSKNISKQNIDKISLICDLRTIVKSESINDNLCSIINYVKKYQEGK